MIGASGNSRKRSHMGRFAALPALALALLCTLISTGHAEDVESILLHGNELRRQGRDIEALAEFQRAARIEDSPRTTAQIALAEQALGMWPEAEAHLSGALGHESDSWINKNRAALNTALGTIHSHLCLVEVWGLPAGAVILVDGKRIGSLPKASAWLSPGEIAVEAKADGYVPLRRNLSIQEGGRVREHVTLRSVKDSEVAEGTGAGAARPAPSKIGSAPATLAAAAEDSNPERRRDPRPITAAEDEGAHAGIQPSDGVRDRAADRPASDWSQTLRQSAKWLSWGGAVIATGLGGYGLRHNWDLVETFDQVCAVSPKTGSPYATDTTRATDASCMATRKNYQAAGQLALYGLVGAGVLAAVGAVFWLTEAKPSDHRTALACTPEVGSHGAGLGCSLQF